MTGSLAIWSKLYMDGLVLRQFLVMVLVPDAVLVSIQCFQFCLALLIPQVQLEHDDVRCFTVPGTLSLYIHLVYLEHVRCVIVPDN